MVSTSYIIMTGYNEDKSSGRINDRTISVRYHFEGSLKLNARILLLAHMVYL
jgi:hypothetical protein